MIGAMNHTRTDPPAQLLLSRFEVERLTGLSTSSLYRAMRHSDFPDPIRVTARSVRWRVDEVLAWIEGRPRASGMHPAA